MYHDGARGLQDRFDTRRLADRLEERFEGGLISPGDKELIEGALTCSSSPPPTT